MILSNPPMMKLTRKIICRIKDQLNYPIKGKIIKINSDKRNGRTKHYIRNHKIQGIGNIKPKKHDKSKEKKVKATKK